MTPMELLLSRASCDSLAEPAPKGEALARILSTALRAPDHGKLRPSRFVAIHGAHRAVLAELIVAGMIARDPEVPNKKIEKRRNRFSNTPLTLALGMHLRPDDKIPLWEQEMTVAAGVMNVLNALHAEGFGGMWVSGDMCEDPAVARALGFDAPHRLAGFLFVGTPEHGTPHAKRPDIEGFMATWDGTPPRFGIDARRED